MNVFDWLSNMEVPAFSKFNIIEVKFKGGRKEYFRNVSQIELFAGDPVIVDFPNGHHLGFFFEEISDSLHVALVVGLLVMTMVL